MMFYKWMIMLVCTILIMWLMQACEGRKNNAGDIPASIIANPNTASGQEVTNELPEITFEKELYDFGRLINGEKVSYSFKFTNTGKGLLLISNVSTSCGCTVPKYPTNPIKPGEQGVISVAFDSSGRSGLQTKTVTVISNTQPNTRLLTITANIMAPETMQ